MKSLSDARMPEEPSCTYCRMGAPDLCRCAPTTSPDTVTVPREPTPEMLAAAQAYCHAARPGRASDIYRAMIAAAPLPSECGGLGSSPAAIPTELAVVGDDQVEAWAQRLYETNAFYAASHADPDDIGWADMAPNDAGIRDLHMDMARAAKAVWDREAPPSTPCSPGMKPLQAAECAQVPAPPGDKGGEP